MDRPKRKPLIFILVAATLVALLCAMPIWALMEMAGRVTSKIARITHADASLQAAAKQARASLPNFKRRLLAPKDGERFAIKGRFSGTYGPEYLWVKDPSTVSDGFIGVLDQAPVGIADKHKGDTVHVLNANVFDWLIRSPDGHLEGGLTDQALNAPVK